MPLTSEIDGLLGNRGLVCRRRHIVTAQREAALNVRVTEEHHWRRSVYAIHRQPAPRENILVLVINRAVHHGKSPRPDGALRKLLEILQISRLKRSRVQSTAARATGLNSSGFVSPLIGFVVVAANGDGVERTHALDHFVGIGAVAHQVAEANSLVPSPFGRLETVSNAVIFA